MNKKRHLIVVRYRQRAKTLLTDRRRHRTRSQSRNNAPHQSQAHSHRNPDSSINHQEATLEKSTAPTGSAQESATLSPKAVNTSTKCPTKKPSRQSASAPSPNGGSRPRPAPQPEPVAYLLVLAACSFRRSRARRLQSRRSSKLSNLAMEEMEVHQPGGLLLLHDVSHDVVRTKTFPNLQSCLSSQDSDKAPRMRMRATRKSRYNRMEVRAVEENTRSQ